MQNMLVRKTYLHGRSMTFSLPGSWQVPKYLHVYTNSVYFVYSDLLGLEKEFNATLVTRVRRRDVVARGHRYYLLTVPKQIALKMGIERGSPLVVADISPDDESYKAFAVIPNLRVIISYIRNLIT